jgi:hypothetical protein
MAAVVAERTGTDVRQDMYPHLVAAALTTATNVAMQHYLRVGPAIGMDTLLPAALAQIAAGLPPPQPTHPPGETPADAATGPPAGTPADAATGPPGGTPAHPAIR